KAAMDGGFSELRKRKQVYERRNLRRAIPATESRPVPRNAIEEGSGTGEGACGVKVNDPPKSSAVGLGEPGSDGSLVTTNVKVFVPLPRGKQDSVRPASARKERLPAR